MQLVRGGVAHAEGGAGQLPELGGRGDREAVDRLRDTRSGVEPASAICAQGPVQVAKEVRRVAATLGGREGSGAESGLFNDQGEGGSEPGACQAPDLLFRGVPAFAHDLEYDPKIRGVRDRDGLQELAKIVWAVDPGRLRAGLAKGAGHTRDSLSVQRPRRSPGTGRFPRRPVT